MVHPSAVTTTCTPSVEKDLRLGSMFKNLCAFAVLGAGGLIAVRPAFAAQNPVRWTIGGCRVVDPAAGL